MQFKSMQCILVDASQIDVSQVDASQVDAMYSSRCNVFKSMQFKSMYVKSMQCILVVNASQVDDLRFVDTYSDAAISEIIVCQRTFKHMYSKRTLPPQMAASSLSSSSLSSSSSSLSSLSSSSSSSSSSVDVRSSMFVRCSMFVVCRATILVWMLPSEGCLLLSLRSCIVSRRLIDVETSPRADDRRLCRFISSRAQTCDVCSAPLK